MKAESQSHHLLGGARGRVRSAAGAHLEGMMVQLVSHKSSIRTTVYSHRDGRYEFPQLEAGWYTLRIARPLQFRPYQRDSVWVEGSPELEEIVLERVTDAEFLPPTPFVTFYEAKPDKKGEIWAGAQRGGRMVRFNPKTDRWIEYVYPEPFSLDWRTWVDNSTDPVTGETETNFNRGNGNGSKINQDY